MKKLIFRMGLLSCIVFSPSIARAAPNYSVSNIQTVEYDKLLMSTSIDPIFIYKKIANDGSLQDAHAMLFKDSIATIEKETSNYYQIKSGNFKGYIEKKGVICGQSVKQKAETVCNKNLIVTATNCFIYEDMECGGNIIDIVGQSTELTLNDTYKKVYVVTTSNGYEGYVKKEDAITQNIFTYAEEIDYDLYYTYHEEELLTYKDTNEELPSYSGSTFGEIVVNYALQFVGNPYKWGGTSLEHGIDCSGFIMRIYEHFGVSLPRSSSEQRNAGLFVCDGWNPDLAMPGDILCYDGHVSMYIGNDRIIHAANKKSGIICSDVTYRKPICVRRIIPTLYSAKELNVLYRIVEAEAGNQGIIGKRLVANVILNRVHSPLFGSTISDVVFSPSQFQPVTNKRFYQVEVTKETKQAVNEALFGIDSSQGALYFMYRKGSNPSHVTWFDTSLTYLFTYKDHEFYK